MRGWTSKSLPQPRATRSNSGLPPLLLCPEHDRKLLTPNQGLGGHTQIGKAGPKPTSNRVQGAYPRLSRRAYKRTFSVSLSSCNCINRLSKQGSVCEGFFNFRFLIRCLLVFRFSVKRGSSTAQAQLDISSKLRVPISCGLCVPS